MRTTLLALALSFPLGMSACTTSSSTTDTSSAVTLQALTDAGCTLDDPDPRACDPADANKTTVCHIPPGNPANAHTICVGNAAVPAHLDHGDVLGTCICPGDDGGSDDGGDGGGVTLQ